MRSPQRPIFAFVLALSVGALVSMPVAAEPKLAADLDRAKADAALLGDEAKAIAEFQRRLRSQFSARDGLLIVQDRSSSDYAVVVMPAAALWSVNCGGSGIDVMFGAGIGETDNGTDIQLTTVAVPDEQCGRIAPAIAQTVLAIIRGE